MTKFEFLTASDFNNLELVDKIKKIIEMIDGDYSTIPNRCDSEFFIKCDVDGNPCEDGKYQIGTEELRKANEEFLNSFPYLREIMTSLVKNKYDIEKTKNDLQEIVK